MAKKMAKKVKKVKRGRKALKGERAIRKKRAVKARRKVKAEKVEAKEKVLGRVEHFFNKISVAAVKVLAPFKVGDVIHIKGHTTDFFQRIESMQIEHQNVTKVKKGDSVGIKVKDYCREHDMIYLADEKALTSQEAKPEIVQQPLFSPPTPSPTPKADPYANTRFVKFVLILALILVFGGRSVLAAFETYGTRPMGMGGAFTAVADDANASYWNPAGLALNPEVSATGSTKLNNRNTWVGDNTGNLKLCYEADMNPFEWIAGVGLASALALQGAHYLSEQGILKKGWGREGEKTERGESMAAQVKGTEEVVSLKEEAKKAAKEAAKGAISGAKEVAKEVVKETVREARRYYMMPWASPWYCPDFHRPHYWERPEGGPSTKAQFALGISWLNDYNPLPQIDQNTNWYTFSLASGFEQRVAVGANVNVYNLQKISTRISGLGADLDLGAIAKPVEYISLGVVTKGILTTDIKWQSGDTTRYEMLVNAGVAVKPVSFLTLAADAHNLFRQATTYHYGAEVVLMPGLLARVGLSDGNKTAGASLAVGNLVLDYAILGGMYNRTQMIGACWRF